MASGLTLLLQVWILLERPTAIRFFEPPPAERVPGEPSDELSDELSDEGTAVRSEPDPDGAVEPVAAPTFAGGYYGALDTLLRPLR